MKYMKFRILSPKHSVAIQKRLFELGCRWSHTRATEPHLTNKAFLFCKGSCITWDNLEDYFNNSRAKETTLDDLYKLNTVKPNTVKLNDKYTAEITPDGIKVGCTLISFKSFNKIKKAVKHENTKS